MACDALRTGVDSCVTAPDCTCFADNGGSQEFVDAIDGAFKRTQAFVMLTDPAYCSVASDNINNEIETNWGCCCSAEVEEYVTCTFNQELTTAFGLVGCERGGSSGGGDGDGEGEGGSSLMFIIIGVVVVLLLCCCCCGCFFWRRRRQRLSQSKDGVNVNVNLSSETKHTTENTTAAAAAAANPNGDVNTQNSKTDTARTSSTDHEWNDSSLDELERGAFGHGGNHASGPYGGFNNQPPPPSHVSSNRGGGFDEDDWSRMEDSVPPRGGMMNRNSSRRGFDDRSYDDDDRTYDSRGRDRNRRGVDRSTRSSRDRIDRSSRSMRSMKSSSRRNLYDDDDYDYDDDRSDYEGSRRSRSKSRRSNKRDKDKKKKKKRSASRSRSLSSDSSDDESDSSRGGRSHYSRSKRKRERDLVKARKLIESHEKHKKEKKLDKQEKETVANEMKSMLEMLKKDREAMEAKLKKAEEEAKSLKLERIESQKSLLELAMQENAAKNPKVAASAELDAVRKEKEEMANLIHQLEMAQMGMMHQSHAMLSDDDQSMGLGSVFGLGGAGAHATGNPMALDELHHRLAETEQRVQQLKLEKKSKKLEIEQLKIMSNGVSTPLIESQENERRMISKQLKRVEEEKAMIHSQIASSHQQQFNDPNPMLMNGAGFDPLLGQQQVNGNGNFGRGGSTHRRNSFGRGGTQQQNMVRTNSQNQLMDYGGNGNGGDGGIYAGGGMMIPGMDVGGFETYNQHPTMNGLQHDPSAMGMMSGMMIDSRDGAMHIADDITMATELHNSARQLPMYQHNDYQEDAPPPTKSKKSKSKKDKTSEDDRPSGWLGETIRRNSCRDLMEAAMMEQPMSYEPLGNSHHKSNNRLDPGGSSHGRSTSGSSRKKSSRSRSREGSSHSGRHLSSDDGGGSTTRDRARRAEKKLRDEMKRSQSRRSRSSSRSLSADSSGEDFY